MFEIRTEVEIDATPECVWDVLLDFRAYQSWNPFLRYVGGTPKVGHRLEVRARPSGGTWHDLSPDRAGCRASQATAMGWPSPHTRHPRGGPQICD